MNHLHNQHSGFTLVELIVGMTIFAIGLTGIYALLSSTMGSASYSRHEIVVANLLREQLELVHNIRDTNVQNFISWDRIQTEGVSSISSFSSGVYVIENNFTNIAIQIDPSNGRITKSPVYLKDITTPFSTIPTDENRFNQSALYVDNQNRYTHQNTGSGTPYASYIIITPLTDGSTNIQKDSKNQGYIIDARVIVHTRGQYREYDAKTVITDWIK